jgi:hypothetical protein
MCGFFTLLPEEPLDGINTDAESGGNLLMRQTIFFQFDGSVMVKVGWLSA